MKPLGATAVNPQRPSKIKSTTLAYRSISIWLLAVLIIFPACHTARNVATQQPAPPGDIAEARRNVADSLNAIQSMLNALNALNKVSGAWPSENSNRFMTNVYRLQADSFKVRAHARAMKSRGDAYFEQWQVHLEQARDWDARKFATEERQTLQQSFDRIQQTTERMREAFEPLMLHVHALRRALENESRTNASKSTKDLVQKAREDAQKVWQYLATTGRELDTVASKLKPVRSVAKG
jgi:hypothetical protein